MYLGTSKETKSSLILRIWGLKVTCMFLYQYKNQEKGNTLKKKLQKPIKVKQNPIV